MASDLHAQALARECKALFRKHCRDIIDDGAPPFPAEVHADGTHVVELIDQLAALSTQTPGEGWISVEDRLPEVDGVPVAVFDPDNKTAQMWPATWSAEYQNFGAGGGWFESDEVTHWLALPKPPATPGEA